MADAYRSYVVRVRRRIDPPEGVHLELEDLLHGRRTALTGDAASTLAEHLLALFDPLPESPPRGSPATATSQHDD